MNEIDELAKQLALRLGLPSDLLVPVATRDLETIIKYIGTANNMQN